MDVSHNLDHFNAELIAEPSRRQRLSLLTTMLTITLRQYLRTHNNELPSIKELPRAGMTLRNAFITDCTVLLNADGTTNEHPFADIVCLHRGGEVQRQTVIDSFVNIRPTAAPAHDDVDDASETDETELNVDEDVDWSAQLETIVLKKKTQNDKGAQKRKHERTAQELQPGRARGRPAKLQIDQEQPKTKKARKARPPITATVADDVVADNAALREDTAALLEDTDSTHQELPDHYGSGANVEDDIVDETIVGGD